MSSSSAPSPLRHPHNSVRPAQPPQPPLEHEQERDREQGQVQQEQQQGQEHIHDSPLVWDSISSDGDYDSLTLPPINSINYWPQELPSFDNNYFDDFTRLASPSLFPLEHNNTSDSPAADSSSQDRPPPSIQHLQLPRPQTSEYGLRSSESPDPYEGFLDLPSEMPPRSALTTRASSVVDLTESSPQVNASKRKRDDDTGEGRAAKATRREPSTGGLRPAAAKQSLGDVEVVDLEDVETLKEYEEARAKQQAEAILQQNQEEANRPVKLSSFQCIICMDNPTDLTVTHCGHLFCSECLHSALHAGDKKTCPVCRTAISTGRPGHKPPRNGTFPLEMKLITVNKKGKQREVVA